ncbi:putative N-acetyltransferase HLS1-like [Vitis vinifera]|uniref:Putative N-acetyltransferase HLS1-like n=1 Tax=Vitis vinifera TaxID=29760 RepID=A0A438FBR9_VITVI|nr:putative N-acetyltransferase HLS1-like [Vitis vinifera]
MGEEGGGGGGGGGRVVVVVREFHPEKDCRRVEEVERRCEVGPSGELSSSRTCWATQFAGFAILPPSACWRMGIGLKLVCRMEEWFRDNGAEYSYIATENDNQASVNLFTDKCGYSKFRTPSILVNPVFAHTVRLPKRVHIFKLSPSDAEALYRRRFSTTEFFPRDIDSVLNNKLNLGTFVAVFSESNPTESWPGSDSFLADPPSRGRFSASGTARTFAVSAGGVQAIRTTLHVWAGGRRPRAVKLVKALCGYAHNLAKERGCGVVATEVSSREPLRLGIPHWKRLSCAEDLWCMKRLGEDYSDGSVGDWTKSHPGPSIFVDPESSNF